jgi:hypothetical protein
VVRPRNRGVPFHFTNAEDSSGAIYVVRALCGISRRSLRFKVLPFEVSIRLKSQRALRNAAEGVEANKASRSENLLPKLVPT